LATGAAGLAAKALDEARDVAQAFDLAVRGHLLFQRPPIDSTTT
jgi:hypothetical protein